MNTVDWRAKGKALGAQHKAAGVSRPATAMMFANSKAASYSLGLATCDRWYSTAPMGVPMSDFSASSFTICRHFGFGGSMMSRT